ncbi:UvrD-helicase domain-containing protein [Pseudorhodoplanes sp.]|uniref:UvrD-helicase domain-containing protein n=1 Tax=Pseudorhodoplanes sp. TaxID=1934341 RepID=UPI002B738564|nr:UvrD-helicase domain-containing protein [Pseudorhodoplanes sp.]HWV55073.1 UvrD-helicase domain-containing protein [Pseudorhodoplanes sp.]
MPVEIDLLAINRGTITAPAGCGKTHLIVDALIRHDGPKPVLVLTHTNAGVAALRARLDRESVPASRYRLYTIDGWAIRLVKTFPKRSEIDPTALLLHDRKRDYPLIREAAWRLLGGRHVDDVLNATYDRLIVDEYQDCSQRQHGIVFHAGSALRTVLLGDPMQAIFGFGDPLPNWTTEVCQHFPVVGQLNIPHRWVRVGEEAFGRWLLDMRRLLEAGGSIDLAGSIPANVRWVPLTGDASDHPARLAAARCNAPGDEKVLIIADSTKPSAQQAYASQIPGAVTVENVDLTDLTAFANGFDVRSANAVEHLVTFAGSVMVNVGANDMITRLASLRAGRARRAASNAEAAALRFESERTYAAAGDVLAAINEEGGVRSHRPAILRGAYNVLKICGQSGVLPSEAAITVREQSRLIGRPLAKRTVGSTLLLKGLEAETCVMLETEKMNANHLYVAMTRGAKQLIICNHGSLLSPR